MIEEPNFSGQMSAMEATVYQTFKVNMLSSLVIKAPIQLGEKLPKTLELEMSLSELKVNW